MSKRTILIPIDESDGAARAFQFYKDNLHQPGNVVNFVNCRYIELPSASFMATEAHVVADILKHSEERSKKVLNEYQAKSKGEGIDCKAWTKSGVAGEAIIETARELNADLIVMGSRGLGTIRRTILGSVSDYVLHHAHIPVLIVPKK